MKVLVASAGLLYLVGYYIYRKEKKKRESVHRADIYLKYKYMTSRMDYDI